MRSVLATLFVFSLLFTAAPQHVQAYAGANPNVIRRMQTKNWRLPVGNAEKYRQSRRSRELRGIDAFTTPDGEDTSFERRHEYLRETQRKRIQEDLDSRPYTGVSRPATIRRENRNNRSNETILRRINRARESGGIRLRRGTATLQNIRGLSSEEKDERIKAYRMEVKDAEKARYNFKESNCTQMRGRRQAQCWYRMRNN